MSVRPPRTPVKLDDVKPASQFPDEAKEQLCVVQWDDAWGGEVWELKGDIGNSVPEPVTTVGFFVLINDKWIGIAQSINEVQYGHVLRIPRSWIINFTLLNIEVSTPPKDTAS